MKARLATRRFCCAATRPIDERHDHARPPQSPLEKTPLERYVPPAKPSLVGLTRAALAEALGAIGVPPAQRKMRVQQIWHWIYVRGAQRLRRR